MKTRRVLAVILLGAVVIASCVKTQEGGYSRDKANDASEPLKPVTEAEASQEEGKLFSEPIPPPVVPIPVSPPAAPELTLEELAGKWLLVTLDDTVDPSGDYIEIKKQGDEYSAIMQYQGYTLPGKVQSEGTDFYFIQDSGERNKISRTISRPERFLYNSIGLDLISPREDIDLGFFQREDNIQKWLAKNKRW